MAKQFLTSIDLSKNQIMNGAIHNLTSAPGSPVSGQVYFNTTDKNIYLYDGTQWIDLTAGTIDSVVGGSGLTASTVGGVATLDVNVDNVTIEVNGDTIRVKDLGISTSKIADSAVTTVKINSGAVTFSKIQQIASYSVIGNVTAGTAVPSEVLIGTDLASASSTTLATSSAIKTYIDNAVGALGNLEGAWDASSGVFPTGSGGTKKGDYWYVTVAGSAGAVNFNVGDVIIAKINSASTSVATDWIQLEVNRDQATTTALGLVQLATNAETQTGTNTNKAVTPSALSARTATETRTGIAEIATQAEADAGTDDTRIITPLKLKTYLDNVNITAASTYSQTLTGSSTSYVVTHNLNSLDVLIEVYEVATGETVYTDVIRTSVNVVTVVFAVAPTSGQYRVVIKK